MPTVRLFKVGADPEFGFLSAAGESVNASSVLRANTRFGLDGCEAIAEMRPLPSINPSQVVHNLYTDFTKGFERNEAIRDLTWKAGSNAGGEYAIGGHIHFGIHSAVAYKLFGERDSYYRELTHYLDCYLAQVTRLIEDPKEISSRLDSEYGYLGDYRSNSHGLEYRTVGSWLTSPRVAEGVLCLAQTIAFQHMWEKVHGRTAELARLAPKPETDMYDEYIGEVNLSKELKNYRKKFPTLQSHIRKFKLYKRHELPIEFIFKLVENKKMWFPGKDIDMKIAWGLSSPTPSAIRSVQQEKILPVVKYDDIWKRARES